MVFFKSQEPKPVKIGDLVPDFSLPDLEGRIWRLSELRGRMVIINFWSAECPWAARADGLLAGLAEQYNCLLLTIAANANESDELLSASAQERSLAPVLLDRARLAADLLGAQTTPHLFLIDPTGILRYQGALDDVTFRQRRATRSYLGEALAALKEGRNPDPAETSAYGCTIVRFHEGG